MKLRQLLNASGSVENAPYTILACLGLLSLASRLILVLR
jgi:hypothetical protein